MKRKELTGTLGCFIILMITAVALASPVPDTGQTKCYDDVGKVITCPSPQPKCYDIYNNEISCPSPTQSVYGQDANYSINPMSYTKLDGSGKGLSDSATSWVMVKDNVTGLIWEVKTSMGNGAHYSDPHNADNTYTWYNSNPATNGGYAGTQGNGTDTEDFIKALNDAHFGGYSDWRLPTHKELAYLEDYEYSSNNIFAQYFPNTANSWYWSITPVVNSDYDVWSDCGRLHKSDYHYARAVRGGQSQSAYVDNGNGTVTDTSTGLMWQQNFQKLSSLVGWEGALTYCENLSLGGYMDWRLPTIKELISLVDESRFGPAINTNYFPNTFVDFPFWSSTTYYPDYSNVLSVDFSNGYSGGSDLKSGSDYTRAVRGGSAAATTPPTPKIQANGQNGSITVSEGTPVSITFSLAPGGKNGINADWWALLSGPGIGLRSWTPYQSAYTWATGINLWTQEPLYSFAPVQLFNSSLSVGETIFCFGVDTNPNGMLVLDSGILDSPIYYDCVYVNVVNPTPTQTPVAIGDRTLGGVVAYILQPGDPGYNAAVQHGLVAAESDQSSSAEWGCIGKVISGADGTAIGTGNQNTIDIVNGCGTAGTAARICYDLVLGGYSDWYLPSLDELIKLDLNRAAFGGFADGFYWSSSERSSGNAWGLYNGYDSLSSKDYKGHVRAVRAF